MSDPASTPTRSDLPAGADAASCLARSVLWQAVSLGLQPPTALTTLRLASAEGATALAAAAGLADPEGGLAGRFQALAAAGAPAVASHTRLFGHTVRGTVPPYETEWGRDDLFTRPHALADLGGFLAAFGLALDRRAHERIDHVGAEAELMAFLAAREGRAVEDGDAEALEVARRAQRSLLRDHLGAFVPAFAQALALADAGGFYGRLGELLHDLVLAECGRARVPAGDAALPLRSTDLDDTSLDCGPAGDLVQIRGAGRQDESR